ncbi:MAG: hypothetical protein ACR2NU_09660 [Aeoliella sp.]
MNYFAHAHPWLDDAAVDPHWLAGLAVPDWLGVAARRTKCRTKHVESAFDDKETRVAELARGVAQHHSDDARFHQSRAFVELSLVFSRMIANHCREQTDLRASFLGHILVELLLDDTLIQRAPERLVRYYDLIAQLDAEWVAGQIESFSGRSVGKLAEFIERFVEIRFLADYTEDRLLVFRLNQVMSRVGLARLPASFPKLLPEFREQVTERADELMNDSDSARTLAPRHRT